MSSEELVQRRYLSSGKLCGDRFGDFEEFNIGATTARQLVKAGLSATLPKTVTFPFKLYNPPKHLGNVKPDRLFAQRIDDAILPVAIAEHKASSQALDAKSVKKAAEQALCAALVLGCRYAVTTDGTKDLYVDVERSEVDGSLAYIDEPRSLSPGVLRDLLEGDLGIAKDPKPLAETVWQIIWHATKEEPRQCLLTFVEIFVLKFLSDNLPASVLPRNLSFYVLVDDPAAFRQKHGVTAIEYYVNTIRPHIKKLFPDNIVVKDKDIPKLFGLKTIVSKTSIINGFAFLKSSQETVSGFNRTFLQILNEFNRFGSLRSIDPQFKLRLYETFLKRSARQQKLGQFFTPRNVVRQMIRMAQLSKLPDGAVLLDPAGGVGGFVLEPLLIEEALPENIKIVRGRPVRRIKTIAVDVDVNTHILAKANMLIHLAEMVRNATTTIPSLNLAMAETFILMNSNETLGVLENPTIGTADVVLTNPPYVTQGSKVYKEEINEVRGNRSHPAKQ